MYRAGGKINLLQWANVSILAMCLIRQINTHIDSFEQVDIVFGFRREKHEQLCMDFFKKISTVGN